jgi:hypothetical protein
MKSLALLLLVLITTSVAVAKSRQWQDAKVLKLTSTQEGTQAVVVPVGTGVYGASVPITRAFYWIKAEKITYVIPNYSNGVLIQRWLVLTIGGTTKVSVDGKNLRLLDDEGKERTVRIVAKIANEQEASR